MSFKTSGPRTRPDRAKPPPPPFSSEPIDTTPLPPSWSKTRACRQSSSASSTPSETFHDAHFPPAEEAAMIAQSNTIKASANAQFAASDYDSAIGTYDKAVAELPNYLDYELAVLQSNIAACHLKLEQWKEALEACEQGLKGLEREMPTERKPKSKDKEEGEAKNSTAGNMNNMKASVEDNSIVELSDSEDEASAVNRLTLSDARKADILRIRTKLLLRRARAHSCLASPSSTSLPESPSSSFTAPPSSWSHLSSSLADYVLLSQEPYSTLLPASDQKTVRRALTDLPPRIEEAKQRETAEMMGKLKELGNGILKPFGLSTDMFKMVKDEGTGGYSMSFGGGGGEKKG